MRVFISHIEWSCLWSCPKQAFNHYWFFTTSIDANMADNGELPSLTEQKFSCTCASCKSKHLKYVSYEKSRKMKYSRVAEI